MDNQSETAIGLQLATSVNTTWRTACPIEEFIDCAGTTPTFLTWYKYYADSEYKMQPANSFHSALFNYIPLVIVGTDKNKQLTIIKPTQTGVNRIK